MKYLIIPLLCMIATSKIVLQSKFAKNLNKTAIDALFFNSIIFLFAGLTSLGSLDTNINAPLLVCTACFGMASVLFQLFYVLAFSSGPVSVTVFVVNSSMIIPILLSVIFYNEVVTPGRIVGIALTFVAFYLNIDKTNNVLINKKWIIFAFLAFIFNSATVIAQKIYTNSFFTANSSSFVALGFSFATIFCAIILFVLKLNKKECSYKPNVKIVLTACCIGLILCFFQILNTFATRIIDGTVLFPLYNGGTLVLTTIISALLYKEKLNFRQQAGMVIGIAAIVLISI